MFWSDFRIIVFLSTLLFLIAGCTSSAKDLRAGWYSMPENGKSKVYLALINQSIEDKEITDIVINEDENEDLGLEPFTLHSGEIKLIPFTKQCRLPVSLKAKVNGILKDIDGLSGMPSAIPAGYKDCQ